MKARIQLDWSRLLGFDQVDKGREPAANSRIAPKISVKPGIKPSLGPALGNRIGARICGKLGSKGGFKPTA